MVNSSAAAKRIVWSPETPVFMANARLYGWESEWNLPTLSGARREKKVSYCHCVALGQGPRLDRRGKGRASPTSKQQEFVPNQRARSHAGTALSAVRS